MSPEERLEIQSFDHVGSGSIEISSSAESSFGVVARLDSAWRIQGFVEARLESSWRVGEGEYYWYRVEGECGSVECDTFGVQHRKCNRMTFTTVVPARDIAEVCERMTAPVLNPPVQARITSIQRYSRPVVRTGAVSPDCNILEDEEFCQIPECEDYCIEQRIVTDIGLQFFVIEAVYTREMSGGINLSGTADTARSFEPADVLLQLSGSSELSVSYSYLPYFSFSMMELSIMEASSVEISGLAEVYSNARVFDMNGGALLFGNAQLISPVWNYPSSYLLSLETESGDELLSENGFSIEFEHSTTLPAVDLILGGGATIGYFHVASGIIALNGDSDSIMRLNHESICQLEAGGSLADLISSGRYYQPSSGANISGEADLGFEDIGIISMNIQVTSSVFDFGYEFKTVDYGSELTISNSFAVTQCGCSSVGLSLNMSHNLFSSGLLSSFVDRNGLSPSSSCQLRYRASDSSWRDTQRYYGTLSSGEQGQIFIFFSLACIEGNWRFSFSIKNDANRAETKFIAETGSDRICGSNDVSTVMELEIMNGLPEPQRGQSIYVVTPHSVRPAPRKQDGGRVNFTVGGLTNEYVVYYDELGVFGDSYWFSSPLRFLINSVPTGQEMQTFDLNKIF